MWNLPDEHSADSSDRSSACVRSNQSTVCFICDARDTIDQEISARWLTARLTTHTSPISKSQLFGVVCCPVHAWRMYATFTSPTSPTAHSANGTSDIYALQQVLSAMVQEFALLASRLARRGLSGHSHSVHNGYREIVGMPTCPLCGEVRSRAEQKALSLFAETYAASSPGERQNLLWVLCPSDHRLIFSHMSRISRMPRAQPLEALSPPPAPRALTDNDGWWQVPGHSTHDEPFVRSLLDPTSDLPDQFCPLCWAQANQEQALAAAMQQGLPRAVGIEGAGIELGGERWQFETALMWDVETLCCRHMALVRTARLSNTHSLERAENMKNAGATFADAWNPSQWPRGALRATPPDNTCPLCRVLSGWDVVRQEGLLRATRKRLLFEDINAQLREALKARQAPLCLPHWRAFTAAADREALDTLLGWEFRTVWVLSDHLHEVSRHLNSGHHADGGGGQDASDLRRATYLFLAGFPK